MEIQKITVLKGPNYWSNFRKNLIVLKLHLGEFENLPSNLIPEFSTNLKTLIPSLYNHRCSEGEKGGFLKRLEEGTWMGHVIEHIALELQWLAGMECGYGRTRPTDTPGLYQVVYSYEIEEAGIYAGKAAIRIVETLAKNKTYHDLDYDIEELKNISDHEKLGPSTAAIIKAAEKRGIPHTRLDNNSLIMLGQGCHQKLICSTVSCNTSSIGVDIAGDKEYTKEILATNYVPVPKGFVVKYKDELDDVIEKLGFPIAIKPQKGNHGRGVSTNINTKEKAYDAFKLANKISTHVIVEQFIKGSDYRILVVNNKFIAAAHREPAKIIGNGINTIKELINAVNQEPGRGEGHANNLTRIKIDDVTYSILQEAKFTEKSVLPKDFVLYLKDTANISTGGSATDVTDFVHPHNKTLFERIARLINLDICGIDVIAEDIRKPISEKNGAIIEVNAGPGLRMHLAPTNGTARNVAEPIIDMLYPENTPSRIPVIAVTGTNGKTTTARLIAYFARSAGHHVGLTTTDGIYINNQKIYKGDCSGPASAKAVLRDKQVDFAVLECARGGILRSGLGFDQCDISIVTNISVDHLGQGDIHTLEELARVKSVVPFSTAENGYAILNADDDMVYALKKDLVCKVALFSINAKSKRIEEHCQEGGLAAVINKGYIELRQHDRVTKVVKVKDIPITFLGTAKTNILNILPAVLAGTISNFDSKNINKWLHDFHPTPENIPGRMNIFDFPDYKILVDYAHNENAFIELKEFFKNVACKQKVGIIAATGDRRPEDIRKVGYYAAQIYDEIIIRHDSNGRGKSNNELTDLMMEGINEVKKEMKVTVISNAHQALQHAMTNASQDSFISYFPDDVFTSLEYIKQAHNEATDSLIVKHPLDPNRVLT